MRIHQLLVKAIFITILLATLPIGTAQAQVTVSSASPSSAPQGTVALSVEIAGSGFDSSAQVAFLVTGTTNSGGITVRKVVARGSRKLIATIDIAADAVIDQFDIEVTLSGNRKGKGTTLFTVQPKGNTDPCTVPGLDFPAAAFYRTSGAKNRIYVSDSTGQCSRSVVTPEYRWAHTLQFSYPVGDPAERRGRIIYLYGDYEGIAGVDFTVSGSADISVERPRIIYRGAVPGPFAVSAGFALSRDGQTIYLMEGCPSQDGCLNRLARLRIGEDSAVPLGFTDSVGWGLYNIAVNAAETELWADYCPRDDQLGVGHCAVVRIPLPGGLMDILHENPWYPGFVETRPEVDPDSPRVAFSELLDGRHGSCVTLAVADTVTEAVHSFETVYGRYPTWLDGQVLYENWRLDSDGLCRQNGVIRRLDPISGQTTLFTNGFAPDGR
jgi:hypothetical protein